MKKLKIKCSLTFLLIVLLASGCDHLLSTEEPEFVSVRGIPALEYWQEQYPDYSIIKWAQEDITDNGRDDTIILFQVRHRQNSMVVVLDYPEGYRITEKTPAPVENQTIEFLDFDDEPPIEFIISGSKDGFVGYAIYRIVDGELMDLFSQDMHLCC